ncbi:hypothetical protein PVAND_001074 [Polypedilum vanderplanki]|uniref:Uncharacterized protein n=1 Tax=Polypedilum vanderplanki TaxID=319348 RepID=A0A9J6BM90_POLVA|nr:hypothetical protein PVAND_001074 [Polypedilum vanderplanki]
MKLIFIIFLLNLYEIKGIRFHGSFNISQIFYNDSQTIFEYNIIPYNNSNFPFHLDEIFEFKFYDVYDKDYFFIAFLKLKIKDKSIEWNKKFSTKLDFYSGLENLSFIINVGKIGDVLTKTFDCWSSMDHYYLKIFYHKPNVHFQYIYEFTNNSRILFSTFKKFYWVIARKEVYEFDNDLNFEEFIDECKKIPITRWLLFVVFGLIFIVIFMVYLYEFVVFIVKPLGLST